VCIVLGYVYCVRLRFLRIRKMVRYDLPLSCYTVLGYSILYIVDCKLYTVLDVRCIIYCILYIVICYTVLGYSILNIVLCYLYCVRLRFLTSQNTGVGKVGDQPPNEKIKVRTPQV
jgi:hypothetical protein